LIRCGLGLFILYAYLVPGWFWEDQRSWVEKSWQLFHGSAYLSTYIPFLPTANAMNLSKWVHEESSTLVFSPRCRADLDTLLLQVLISWCIKSLEWSNQ
jgi:hypothetical protein